MCNCIDEIDKSLAAPEFGNTKLDLPLLLIRGIPRVLICTIKRDPRKRIRPIKLLAQYCPFCGEIYKEG